MTMRRALLLNGPNLDMLGTREPEVYGKETLAGLEAMLTSYAQRRGVEVTCFQSNSESVLIDEIHHAPGRFDGIVYNPGAHTHYSYSLRDAVGSIDVPVVEVHISDVDAREAFRHVSVIAPACAAQVKGLGFEGYCRALDILCDEPALGRLGEGYESRFPQGSRIVVAGEGEYAETGGRAASADETDSGGAEAGRGCEDGFAMPVELGLCSEDRTASAAEEGNQFPQADPTSQNGELIPQPAASAPSFDAQAASAARVGRIRAACEQAGLAALLVRDTSNIRWASAIDGVFDEERAHALLVAPNVLGIHTDTRYSNALRQACAEANLPFDVNDERMSHAQYARDAFESAGLEGKLGMEDSVTYAEFAKLAETFGTGALAATTDLVLGLRAVKDEGEIARLRAAQAVTDAAFEHILGFMRPGMTEREVQLELEGFMLRSGAEGLAFGSIVACGPNGADPHAIPGQARLQAGQCVVMDFGAKVRGYCSDMTRTVFLGQPDGEMARAWEVLRQANETVQAMLAPGVTGKQAHEEAERVLAEGGFAGKMGHGLGHGVGIDVHELPVLNLKNDAPLVTGNVVTVEPGIYVPGEFGMRLEDCGVVTGAGYEAFSRIGHDLFVI